MTGSAVTERRIEVEAAGEPVPGLVWSPAGVDGPRPALLMGHGRGTDKRFGYLAQVARGLVADHGWVAVALDAPGHGERRPPGLGPDEVPPKPDFHRARDEWREAIDTLVAERAIDAGALGWWGFSMGAATGIALLAVEPRIACAAIGLMHTRYDDAIEDDARLVDCPTLFTVHWDDERVPRDGAFALFDALGTADKRLYAYPGGHAASTAEELADVERFLVARLSRG